MGRYIVFALILANLIYFLWNYTHPVVVPDQKLPEISTDVQLLTLLHERDLSDNQRRRGDEQTASGGEPTAIEELILETETPETVVAVTAEAETTPGEAPESNEEEDVTQTEETAEIPPQVSCYTLGPFTDGQVAQMKTAEIKEIGLPVTQRAIEEREIKHYWIYLPPFTNARAAQKASRELAKNGIKDYFIVTTDENRNAISLGLFKRQSGAKRRARHIRELGFKPKIEVRYRNKTYYWLDYEETGDDPLPSQLWQSIETDKGPVQRITRDCT